MLPRELDPWGEWRDPERNPDVADFVVEHRPTYVESVGFIRAERPREDNHAATAWWSTTPARAHLINALLRRDGRTVEEVERDLDIPASKVYYYLREFGMSFTPRPGNRVVVIGYGGERYNGIRRREVGDGVAEIIIPEHGVIARASWSRTSRMYRLLEPLPRTLPMHAAAEALDVSEETLRRALRALGITVYQRVAEPVLRAMFPERERWLEAV